MTETPWIARPCPLLLSASACGGPVARAPVGATVGVTFNDTNDPSGDGDLPAGS